MNLLIRIKDDFIGRRVNIARGQAAVEFAATCFIEDSLIETLLERVEFSLTHGAFETQQ